MKTNTHPNYHLATVTCTGCDTVFQVGSTVDSIRVDICSNCHPFYTGQKKLVDTEGRVERFERRSAQKKQKSQPKKAVAQPVYAKSKPAPTSSAQTKTDAPADTNRPKTLREMLQDAANNS